MKKATGKVLSLCLALALVFGFAPVQALAEGGDSDTPAGAVDEITAIAQPEAVSVPAGTAQESLPLPGGLAATATLAEEGGTQGQPATLPVAQWNCTGYDPDTPGEYTFAPTLGELPYPLAAGLDLPTLAVVVQAAEGSGEEAQDAGGEATPFVVTAFATLAPEVALQTLPVRAPAEDIVLPPTVDATVDGQEAQVPVVWDTASYTPLGEGPFTLTAQLEEGYVLDPPGLPLPAITVERGGKNLLLRANSISAAVNLGSYASFEAAAEDALGPGSFPDVTELVITGATTGGSWTTTDRDYLNANFQNAAVLDLSGYTGTFATSAFYNCTAITAVHLPAGKALSGDMFRGCTSLATLWVEGNTRTEEVVDLTGAASFEERAFQDCTAITDVRLPAGAALSAQMFQDCTSLATLWVGNNQPTDGVVDLTGAASFGDSAFWNCTAITAVHLPAGAALSRNMFLSCTSLATLWVGDNTRTEGVVDLTGFTASFEDFVFADCTAITAVHLPAGAALSEHMFWNCTSLATLWVGDNTRTEGVVDLTGFTASFETFAFYRCTAITAVRLPAGVDVSESMFDGCTSLATVVFDGDIAPRIDPGAFDGTPAIAYVPDKNTGGYESAYFYVHFAAVMNIVLPSVSAGPQSQTVAEGGSASFSITAAGAPDVIAYQWQVSADSGASWADLAGETSAALTLSSAALGQNGNQYRCVATSMLGSATSGAATLIVIPASISPTSATFDKYTQSPGYADLAATLTPGSYTFSALKIGGETLTAPADYTVSGNTYTLKKERLAQLATGAHTITFVMSGGVSPALALTVSNSTPADAAIAPQSAAFDKYAQSPGYADLAVTLTPGSYTFSALKIGGETLAAPADYTVSGNTYTLKKERLAQLATGAHTITFVMSGGVNPALALTVSNSTPGTVYKTWTDAATGVVVSGVFMDNAVPTGLTVRPMGTAEADYTALLVSGKEAVAAYDVSLTGSYTLAPGEKITVSFPVNAALNGKTLLVRHKTPGGTVEEFAPAVQNGKAAVMVASLSPFMLLQDSQPVTSATTSTTPTAATSPQTGDANAMGLWIALLCAAFLALAGCGAVLWRKNRLKQK